MSVDVAALAARLVVGIAGATLHPAERAWLERRQPAGVILFGRNIEGNNQLRGLCRELHAAVPGLEVVVDHEGGPVSVAAAAVGRPPCAATLGLLDDEDLTRHVHEESGRRLAAAGVDRVLGPVADVLVEARNPVIGVRAFGSDEDLVARHVAAAVDGLLAGGVLACLKHWPGHGGTVVDSHLGLGGVGGSFMTAPFVAGLGAGADALMVGHLATAPTGRPATLDPAVAAAARALAGERGLILYADDITMGALRGPLAADGVPVPAGEGLVEPGALTGAWLAAVAAGGCERLLIRGIPWRACAAAEPGPQPTNTVRHPDAPAGPVTAAVRDRLRSLPGTDLAGADTVLHVDRTADDRWGPLERSESVVVVPAKLLTTAPRRAVGTGRLLVTSHRPLVRAAEVGADWLGVLAPTGRALAVGHPALADDLEALLPAAWSVVWLPEWPGPGQDQIV